MTYARFFNKKQIQQSSWYNDGFQLGGVSFRLSNISKNLGTLTSCILPTLLAQIPFSQSQPVNSTFTLENIKAMSANSRYSFCDSSNNNTYLFVASFDSDMSYIISGLMANNVSGIVNTPSLNLTNNAIFTLINQFPGVSAYFFMTVNNWQLFRYTEGAGNFSLESGFTQSVQSKIDLLSTKLSTESSLINTFFIGLPACALMAITLLAIAPRKRQPNETLDQELNVIAETTPTNETLDQELNVIAETTPTTTHSKSHKSYEERLKNHKGEIPPEFYCPILNTIMQHPEVTDDGNTYSQKGLDSLLATNPNAKCPLNPNLTITKRIKNDTLKSIIDEFANENETTNTSSHRHRRRH